MQFNVGLTLQTTVEQFDQLLADYGGVIASVYFSLPLGAHFHTRLNVERQFQSKKSVELFWELLACIQSHGIKLETLFNGYHLTDEEIKRAAETLDQRGIKVDHVGLLDRYYEVVNDYFPAQKKIFSYNNGIRTAAQFEEVNGRNDYDYYVFGNSCMRDEAMFQRVRDSGKKTILLVNNGCSFNCNWCKSNACIQTFERNLQEKSVEYLYALQSMFPCEILDGVVDVSNVDVYKISNRTSDVHYLRDCLESYTSGDVRRFVKKDKNNFAIWGRVGYFWKYFRSMDLERIIAYKQEILGQTLCVK